MELLLSTSFVIYSLTLSSYANGHVTRCLWGLEDKQPWLFEFECNTERDLFIFVYLIFKQHEPVVHPWMTWTQTAASCCDHQCTCFTPMLACGKAWELLLSWTALEENTSEPCIVCSCVVIAIVGYLVGPVGWSKFVIFLLAIHKIFKYSSWPKQCNEGNDVPVFHPH